MENIDVKTPELDHRELELFSSLWLDKIDHCDTLCVPCKSGLFIITPILRVLVPLSYILYPLKWVWQIYWMSHAAPQYAMHYHHGILLLWQPNEVEPIDMGGQSKQMINYDILCKRTKKTNFMQRLLSIFSGFISGVWKAF